MSYEDHLDRLAEDMDKDRRIRGSVFCGKCGYNLRSLPYVYQCPECGNEYNARPLVMTGVFLPQHLPVPIIDLLAVLFFGYIAYSYISQAIAAKVYGSLGVGVAAAVLGVIYLRLTITKLQHHIRGRILIRRIAQSDDD